MAARVDSEALAPALARKLAPLYTIIGAEPLLALEAADRIRAAARQAGYLEREVFIADGQHFDWPGFAAAAQNLSLFGSLKVLDLRIPGGKPGLEGGKTLAAHCAALPPDTLTLVSLPRLDGDGFRAAWFKALDSAGTVVEAKVVERRQLPAWIAGRLAAQDQQADRETLEFIADRVEGNLLAARQEIDKLRLLLPPGRLDAAAVRAAVLDVARYDVQTLAEALLDGDAARFLRVLDGLRGEGEGPPLVLWALSTAVRGLALAARASLAGGDPRAALNELRLPLPMRKALERAIGRHPWPVLAAALARAARADRVAKGVEKGDVWDEMLGLGMELLRPRPAPGPRARMKA